MAAEGGNKTTLAEGIIKLIVDNELLKKGISGSTSLIKGFGKEVVSIGKMLVFWGPIEDTFKKIATATSLVGASMTALSVASTMTYARTQVLDTVMQTVGKNAGYMSEQITSVSEAIKKMGITSQEASSAVIRLAQGEIKLEEGAKLARVAQDLAVISGQNSSQAYGTLIDAIATFNPMLLRQFGMTKTLTTVQDEYARTINKTSETLTELEKRQAIVNYIMIEGKKAAGNYEMSMDDAGKKVGSLERLFEELRNEIGKQGMTLYKPIMDAVYALLSDLDKLPPAIKTVASMMIVFGGGAASMAAPIFKMITTIALWTAILKLGGVALDWVKGKVAFAIPFFKTLGDLLTGETGILKTAAMAFNELTAAIQLSNEAAIASIAADKAKISSTSGVIAATEAEILTKGKEVIVTGASSAASKLDAASKEVQAAATGKVTIASKLYAAALGQIKEYLKWTSEMGAKGIGGILKLLSNFGALSRVGIYGGIISGAATLYSYTKKMEEENKKMQAMNEKDIQYERDRVKMRKEFMQYVSEEYDKRNKEYGINVDVTKIAVEHGQTLDKIDALLKENKNKLVEYEYELKMVNKLEKEKNDLLVQQGILETKNIGTESSSSQELNKVKNRIEEINDLISGPYVHGTKEVVKQTEKIVKILLEQKETLSQVPQLMDHYNVLISNTNKEYALGRKSIKDILDVTIEWSRVSDSRIQRDKAGLRLLNEIHLQLAETTKNYYNTIMQEEDATMNFAIKRGEKNVKDYADLMAKHYIDVKTKVDIYGKGVYSEKEIEDARRKAEEADMASTKHRYELRTETLNHMLDMHTLSEKDNLKKQNIDYEKLLNEKDAISDKYLIQGEERTRMLNDKESNNRKIKMLELSQWEIRLDRYKANVEMGIIESSLLKESTARKISVQQDIDNYKEKLQIRYKMFEKYKDDEERINLDLLKSYDNALESSLKDFISYAVSGVKATSSFAYQNKATILNYEDDIREAHRRTVEEQFKLESKRLSDAIEGLRYELKMKKDLYAGNVELANKAANDLKSLENDKFNLEVEHERTLKQLDKEKEERRMGILKKVYDFVMEESLSAADYQKMLLEQEVVEYLKYSDDIETITKYTAAKLKKIYDQSADDAKGSFSKVKNEASGVFKTVSDFMAIMTGGKMQGLNLAPKFGAEEAAIIFGEDKEKKEEESSGDMWQRMLKPTVNSGTIFGDKYGGAGSMVTGALQKVKEQKIHAESATITISNATINANTVGPASNALSAANRATRGTMTASGLPSNITTSRDERIGSPYAFGSNSSFIANANPGGMATFKTPDQAFNSNE